MSRANEPMRSTFSEGALAPLLGELQRGRASGWLRLSAMEVRVGIPSIRRFALRLLEGRVVGAEIDGGGLAPLAAESHEPAGLAERATRILARALACRDGVQAWEPATGTAESDPAAPLLAAVAARAVALLPEAATVRTALGPLDRSLTVCTRTESGTATLTASPRSLLARVRGGMRAGELIGGGDDSARDLLTLLCAGAVEWVAAPAAPAGVEQAVAPAPPVPSPPAPPPARIVARSDAAPPDATARGRSAAPPPNTAELRQEIESAHARLRGTTHFERLGVSPTASPDEVRQAFTRLARRYHPDSHRDPALQDLRLKLTDVFVAVSEAYGVLKDPVLREQYERSTGERAGVAPSSPRMATPAATWPSDRAADEPIEMRLLRAEEALAARQPWEAIRLLEEAVPAAGGALKVRAQVLLGKAYADRERPREAERILLEVLQADPRCVTACLVLGRLYRDRGMLKRSRGLFERVLEVDPGHEEARRELSALGDAPAEPTAGGSLLSRVRDRR